MSKRQVNVKRLLETNNSVKLTFDFKAKVSKDSYVLRFLLPEQEAVLGFETCQYLQLEAEIDIAKNDNQNAAKGFERFYHPVSQASDQGFVDFLIKLYPKQDKGSEFGVFSNYLFSLESGQVITCKGPFGALKYLGNGTFSLKVDQGEKTRKIKRIGMICGGTGIVPMFQLSQQIISNSGDDTAISLIYATKTLDEMIFIEDLAKYEAKGKMNFYPVVENVALKKWKFGTGLITEDIVDSMMPYAGDKDSLIILCGPIKMVRDYILPMLKRMGYSNEYIFYY